MFDFLIYITHTSHVCAWIEIPFPIFCQSFVNDVNFKRISLRDNNLELNKIMKDTLAKAF